MEIRHMTPRDDRLEISDIYEKSWKHTYRGIIPQAFLDAIPPGRWADRLDADGRETLLCIENGRPVGVCSFSPSRFEAYASWGEIISLYLLPPFLGKGYGKALLSAALEQLQKDGFSDVFLWVLEENAHARAFYEKMGFSFSGDILEDSIGGKTLREIRYVCHQGRESAPSCGEGYKMEYEIVPLPKEVWEGTVVPIGYTTGQYYDLELASDAEGYSVALRKKRFGSPVTHTPEEYGFPDRLYQAHWEKAQAWGIVSGGGSEELLACIEICPEEWSNRLIVTELWVSEPLRRRGVGRRLMDLAKAQARAQSRRAIILETQSCNADAVAFYRSQGFDLIGFDTCCYSNADIERKEVRLNMGYFL